LEAKIFFCVWPDTEGQIYPRPSAVGAGDEGNAAASSRKFFGQNLDKSERNLGKSDWVNLIRFGQNQNLTSPKTLQFARLRRVQMLNEKKKKIRKTDLKMRFVIGIIIFFYFFAQCKPVAKS